MKHTQRVKVKMAAHLDRSIDQWAVCTVRDEQFAYVSNPSEGSVLKASIGPVHYFYAFLTTVTRLVAAFALPDRAAISIWRHRQYQTNIAGRPVCTPYGLVPFNYLIVLSKVCDCISMNREVLHDLII